MKKIAIHQPNFFPWLGYFNKISNCDIFVFLDDVQFSKGSYTSRTKIMNLKTPAWLSLPISYSFGQKINRIKVKKNWKKVILTNIYNAYFQKSQFNNCWSSIEKEILDTEYENLDQINLRFIKFICEKFDFDFEIKLSSQLNIKTKSEDKIIDILKEISTDTIYLSGTGASKYQSSSKFEKNGIELNYQEFKETDKKKIFGDKINYQGPKDDGGLSVLDSIFNFGWKKTANLIINNGKFYKSNTKF